MIKFAVLNPLDGTYTDAATEQERDTLLAQYAWTFFLQHTFNAPYSVAVVHDDGTESWTAPNGSPILSPAQLEAMSAQWVADENKT